MIDSAGRPRAAGIAFGREIGQGGQAQVFEAEDARGRRIAVKVLRTRDPERETAFFKECALVKRVRDAAVVPVHEVFRTEDQRVACSMELVEGTTLSELVRRGEVPSSRALAVVASTARALASVHDARIVHRDVKPGNILVEPGGRVRLLDFGVAADLLDRSSPPPMVAGTPNYLAPEQAQGLAATPAVDIWALGVVLYELLTGAVPFEGPSFANLLAAIVFKPPVAPRSRNPALDPATEAIVLRCLAKRPEERFRDARALADACEPLLGGSSIEEALAPVILRRLGAPAEPGDEDGDVPLDPLPSRADATQRHRWSWDFDAPPAKLWEVVSDTDKFNRAIGLPPVVLRDVPDGRGGIERIGSLSWLGIEVEWVEHPFEWVAPERLSVLRVYRKGPIQAMWSEMTLAPRADGGTTLVHELLFLPRGALGRVAAALEVRLRAKKKIEGVYRRLAELARAREPLALSFPRTPLAAGGEERLSRGLAKVVEKASSFAPLASRLAALVRGATDPDVTRIRPFEIAARWEVPRRQVLALLARAAEEGVLELAWHILCPVCRVPTTSYPTLAALRARAHCEACGIGYDTDFARSVEAVFRPRPEVRSVPLETYCRGGPGFFPHVSLQQRLDPGETRSLTVNLPPGPWRLAVRGLRGSYEFESSPEAQGSTAHVVLERATIRPGPPRVASGVVGFTFGNAGKRRRIVRVESAAWREDAVTALDACGIPELRRLGAAAPPGEPVKIESAAWLAAHGVERRPFADMVEASGGAPSPAALLAGFTSATAALSAAFPLARDGARVALHVGPALACALGEGTGWDGPAPRIALELLADCQAGEVAATHLVLGSPGVAKLVGTRETRAQTRHVNGSERLGVVYMFARGH